MSSTGAGPHLESGLQNLIKKRLQWILRCWQTWQESETKGHGFGISHGFHRISACFDFCFDSTSGLKLVDVDGGRCAKARGPVVVVRFVK